MCLDKKIHTEAKKSMYFFPLFGTLLGRPESYYQTSHGNVFSFPIDATIDSIEKEVNEHIAYAEISSIMRYSLSVEGENLVLRMTYSCMRSGQAKKQLKFKLFVDTDLEQLKDSVMDVFESASTVSRSYLVTMKKKRFFGMFHTVRYLYGMFYTV